MKANPSQIGKRSSSKAPRSQSQTAASAPAPAGSTPAELDAESLQSLLGKGLYQDATQAVEVISEEWRRAKTEGPYSLNLFIKEAVSLYVSEKKTIMAEGGNSERFAVRGMVNDNEHSNMHLYCAKNQIAPVTFVAKAVGAYLNELAPEGSTKRSVDLKCASDFLSPRHSIEGHQVNALYHVREWYEKTVRGGNWENGVNEMNGMYELLRHHRCFALEAEAVRGIWEGHAILVSTADRINEAVDGPQMRAKYAA